MTSAHHTAARGCCDCCTCCVCGSTDDTCQRAAVPFPYERLHPATVDAFESAAIDARMADACVCAEQAAWEAADRARPVLGLRQPANAVNDALRRMRSRTRDERRVAKAIYARLSTPDAGAAERAQARLSAVLASRFYQPEVP